jgi:hypothetical protein
MHVLNYLHVGARVLVLVELVEFVISTSFLCILISTHDKDLLLPVAEIVVSLISTVAEIVVSLISTVAEIVVYLISTS